MDINLFVNTSEPEKLDKTLISQISITGFLRESSSIIDPVILIEGNVSTLALYNYAYIPEFERYYFINNIESFRTGLVRVYMHVDVLTSFKSGIRSNNALIDRQKDNGNYYLNDGVWKHEAREFYTIKTFPNGFNDNGEYILITAGA